MKKLLFLGSILFYCFSSYGQTLSAPATVESGNEFTVTVNGETDAKYVSSISLDVAGTTSLEGGSFVHLSGTTMYGIDAYVWTDLSSQTTFKMRTNSSVTTVQTVTFKFNVNYGLNNGSGSQLGQVLTVTVKVNGLPTVFRNVAKSQTFYKSDCPSGYQSDPYTYTVPANKYTASTQADADAQAQAEINANGQNTANSNLTCKQVFYNTEISGSFTRNNCGAQAIPGPPIVYTVPANKYSAFTQAEADAKAQNELNANGQNNANNVGVCIATAYISGLTTTYRGRAQHYSVINGSAGDTYVWSVQIKQGTVQSGQGTSSADIFFNEIGGPLPTNVIVKVTITNALGAVTTLTLPVTTNQCNNCPIN